MPIADALLTELDQEAQTTRRVLDNVPEDKLAWRPHPKSYSLGQLAMHIAAAPGRVAAAAQQDVFEANFRQSEAASKQEILDAFTESLASARAAVQQMDDAYLMAPWTAVRNGKPVMTVPRVAFLRSIMLNHIYHHRGQLSVYLRLLDVAVPSIYGPSADEDPFA
jgi:uncharacterized damage-inducible protein DinB